MVLVEKEVLPIWPPERPESQWVPAIRTTRLSSACRCDRVEEWEEWEEEEEAMGKIDKTGRRWWTFFALAPVSFCRQLNRLFLLLLLLLLLLLHLQSDSSAATDLKFRCLAVSLSLYLSVCGNTNHSSPKQTPAKKWKKQVKRQTVKRKNEESHMRKTTLTTGRRPICDAPKFSSLSLSHSLFT